LSATRLGRACAIGLALAVNASVVRAEVLYEGKPPAQLFVIQCGECHKGPRGLVKSPSGLSSFLREHYTTGRDQAEAIAKYLLTGVSAAAPAAQRPTAPAAAAVGEEPAPRPGTRSRRPATAAEPGPAPEPGAAPTARVVPPGEEVAVPPGAVPAPAPAAVTVPVPVPTGRAAKPSKGHQPRREEQATPAIPAASPDESGAATGAAQLPAGEAGQGPRPPADLTTPPPAPEQAAPAAVAPAAAGRPVGAAATRGRGQRREQATTGPEGTPGPAQPRNARGNTRERPGTAAVPLPATAGAATSVTTTPPETSPPPVAFGGPPVVSSPPPAVVAPGAPASSGAGAPTGRTDDIPD
jgi:hypothetical protein